MQKGEKRETKSKQNKKYREAFCTFHRCFLTMIFFFIEMTTSHSPFKTLENLNKRENSKSKENEQQLRQLN